MKNKAINPAKTATARRNAAKVCRETLVPPPVMNVYSGHKNFWVANNKNKTGLKINTMKVDPKDSELFRNSVGRVNPMRSDKREPTPPARKPRVHTPALRQQSYLADPFEENTIGPDSQLRFQRHGPHRKTLQRMQRGQLPIEDNLDLHGFNTEQARQTLEMFIQHCSQQQMQCVHIIHGKGYRSEVRKPKLKTLLNFWLPQMPEVLAFCSADARHGGTGAVFVLLRQKRN